MSLTCSLDIPLRIKMPAFRLKDSAGKTRLCSRLGGPNGLLVVFTCNRCPCALMVWPRLIRLARQAHALGVNTVAINPHAGLGDPEESPEMMGQRIQGADIPYLRDSDQSVARAWQARCTPEPFLFDSRKNLVYHGRFDDSLRDEAKVKKPELAQAIAALAAGESVEERQTPALGCAIEWLRQTPPRSG
jgi:hypothetical protein